MVTFKQRPAQAITLKGERTVLVQTKSTGSVIRLVQTVSPVPTAGGTVDFIDGGNF
jgi:hypothetical protein